MDIWIFQKALIQRLTIWALVSVTLGALCFLPVSNFWGALAFQFLGWALIDLGIAGVGYISVRRRLAELSATEKEAVTPAETSKMITLLQGSTILSTVFLLGGLVLWAYGSFWAGAGTGIILQAAFILFFSQYHLLKLR